MLGHLSHCGTHGVTRGLEPATAYRGAISTEVWTRVNERLVGKTINRASIINFLNVMVDEGVLDYHEKTCKRGYRFGGYLLRRMAKSEVGAARKLGYSLHLVAYELSKRTWYCSTPLCWPALNYAMTRC